jgi:YVTN family beta-propeller protein
VISKRLFLAGYPFDIVVAPTGNAWLTRCHAASMDCIGLEPLRLRGSVSTSPTPTRIAVIGSGDCAYVTNQFTSEVAVIDLQQRQQVGAIRVPGNPLGAVLSLDGQTLYVTTNLDCLHAIRLPAGQITRSIPIPMACTSLLLHPGGTRLFVPTFRAGTILEVDAKTLKTLGSYHVGGVVHELSCTPDGLRLYATNEDGWLDAIQLTTGRRDSLQLGTMAHGLALSPDGAVLYIGLLSAGEVAVVDRQTLTRVSTIRTGGKPRRIAFDATGRRAIIANESGWVDLVT